MNQGHVVFNRVDDKVGVFVPSAMDEVLTWLEMRSAVVVSEANVYIRNPVFEKEEEAEEVEERKEKKKEVMKKRKKEKEERKLQAYSQLTLGSKLQLEFNVFSLSDRTAS